MNAWIVIGVIAFVAVFAGIAVVNALSSDGTDVSITEKPTSCSIAGAEGSACPVGGCTKENNCGYEGCAAKKGLSCNCRG